ncbi:unnamed protein product [Protopolystoma xenopodis]|uniref:Uncharacterized protein n=1 Tax=Protopolystoma xenopodis TaxID=117903 RepID=A0A3S5B5Z8_9PLAT|nr:unnamed protein product [Protopolystoma xenopodis]
MSSSSDDTHHMMDDYIALFFYSKRGRTRGLPEPKRRIKVKRTQYENRPSFAIEEACFGELGERGTTALEGTMLFYMTQMRGLEMAYMKPKKRELTNRKGAVRKTLSGELSQKCDA